MGYNLSSTSHPFPSFSLPDPFLPLLSTFSLLISSLSIPNFSIFVVIIRIIIRITRTCIDSRGQLRRQPTMTTHHCCLSSLSPTGWCSITDLLDTCVSRTYRSSTPVNVRTVTGFSADDTV